MKTLPILFLMIVMAKSTSVKSLNYYCGEQLSATLAVWCNTYEKRATDMDADSADYNEVHWPWLYKRYAKALSMPTANKRGVVDECCKNPCSMDVLLEYCEAFRNF